MARDFINLKSKLWSGDCFWNKENKTAEFISNNYWQIGWNKTDSSVDAVKAWKNFSKIKKHDLFVIKSYAEPNELSIRFIGEVVSINEDDGKVFLQELKSISKFQGKAPPLKAGKWNSSLLEIKGKTAINKILGIKGQEEMENMSNNNIEECKNLLLNTHNLILHGAPGTGKTYLAKDIAANIHFGKKFSDLSEDETKELNNYFKLVQFHPSYDYTDFVEGLRPIESESGSIGFERIDGVFKDFCKKALENYENSRKDNSQLEKEFSSKERVETFLANAVEEEKEFKTKKGISFFIKSFDEKHISAFYKKGNEYTNVESIKLTDILSLLAIDKEIQRSEVKIYLNRKMERQSDSYSSVIVNEIRKEGLPETSAHKIDNAEKEFIFIIDEINRGEISKIFGELFYSIDPGYRGTDGRINTQYQNLVEDDDPFHDGFYIPENVYIIGTMNDIDRSVESMDFAFRRRFTFKEILAEDTQEGILNSLDEDINKEAIDRMDSLNRAIWNKENTGIPGLSSAYHIGGAYFKKLETLKNEQDKFKALWEYHLKGLLQEYLRGSEDAEENLSKLENAYNLVGKGSSDESGNS